MNRVFLILTAFLFIQLSGNSGHCRASSNQEAPALSEIARYRNGAIWTMFRNDAIKYCSERGMRLPTIKELALYAESQGAKGIKERTPRRDRLPMWKWKYSLERAINPDGTVDEFYFNSKDYEGPAEVAQSGPPFPALWSSSRYDHTIDRFNGPRWYHLNLHWGYLGTNDDTYARYAVRCLNNQ